MIEFLTQTCVYLNTLEEFVELMSKKGELFYQILKFKMFKNFN